MEVGFRVEVVQRLGHFRAEVDPKGWRLEPHQARG